MSRDNLKKVKWITVYKAKHDNADFEDFDPIYEEGYFHKWFEDYAIVENEEGTVKKVNCDHIQFVVKKDEKSKDYYTI